MQLLCLLAENIYLMMENLRLEYTLFKTLMVRVNYTTFSPYSYIRIKLVKEITFFCQYSNQACQQCNVFKVTLLAVTVLTILDKRL